MRFGPILAGMSALKLRPSTTCVGLIAVGAAFSLWALIGGSYQTAMAEDVGYIDVMRLKSFL